MSVNIARLAQILSDLTSGHGHGPLTTFSEKEVADALAAATEPKSLQTTAPEAESAAGPGYHVPGPYEIALAVAQGLCAAGTYPTPGAACQAAWMAVPEFYIGRDNYLRDLAPMFYALQNGAYEDAGGGPTNPT